MGTKRLQVGKGRRLFITTQDAVALLVLDRMVASGVHGKSKLHALTVGIYDGRRTVSLEHIGNAFLTADAYSMMCIQRSWAAVQIRTPRRNLQIWNSISHVQALIYL